MRWRCDRCQRFVGKEHLRKRVLIRVFDGAPFEDAWHLLKADAKPEDLPKAVVEFRSFRQHFCGEPCWKQFAVEALPSDGERKRRRLLHQVERS